MLNGKVMITHLTVGLIKKILCKMSQYFPKLYEPFRGDINVKVALSNHATKANLKNATRIDRSKLAAKFDLASLKAEVDKIYLDKLKNVPTNLSNLKSKIDKLNIDKLAPVLDDLSKLSNIIKNDVVKETEYNAKMKHIENKIADITNLATKATLNAKTNEDKGEIPSVNNLAINTALTAVENKIPNVINLVKKLTITQKLLKLKKTY